MKYFLLIQRSEMVPGAWKNTRIGGGEPVPRYLETTVMGPYDSREEAVAKTAAARDRDTVKAVLFVGELL